MYSKIAQEERTDFCHRLTGSMVAAGYQATVSVLMKEFNPRADGAAVSLHGARKWLIGTAFPTQERLHVLARWLNVSPQWLRYGEGESDDGVAANNAHNLELREVILLNDLRRLDEGSQQVVRDLVGSLLKHHGVRR
jgi:hypothetical protein